MVWPTLGSRTAKEQNRTEQCSYSVQNKTITPNTNSKPYPPTPITSTVTLNSNPITLDLNSNQQANVRDGYFCRGETSEGANVRWRWISDTVTAKDASYTIMYVVPVRNGKKCTGV